MMPELVYTMLACARIGAVHSVVFGGFSAESLRDRIVDARCRMVVTANEGLRGGKRIPLKKTVDQAIEGMSLVETVLVARRTDSETCRCRAGRDHWLEEECSKQRSTCTNEWMGAEDPLFILYTSGSTGKPKGLLHTTGGYLVYAASTHKNVFDYHPGDVYFCAADVGWVTGHSYIVYGPLANGATTVMFESTPVYPDAGRYWRIVDDLGVNIFYTAPTALRALAQRGQRLGEALQAQLAADPRHRRRADQPRDLALVPRRRRRRALRRRRHLVADRDRRDPDHAAAGRDADQARLGDAAVLRHQAGGRGSRRRHGARGQRRERRALPRRRRGRARRAPCGATTSASRRPTSRSTPATTSPATAVRRDEDGYYWITGRIDDVLNVSGHRLGTAEIESALVAHEAVAEAAVVGFPHPIKGQGIYAYVALTADYASNDKEQVIGALKEQVRHAIGAFAAPDVMHVASGLPKTRSGKIMRRILRKIAVVGVRGARRPDDAGRARGRGAADPGAQGRAQVAGQSPGGVPPSSARCSRSASRSSCSSRSSMNCRTWTTQPLPRRPSGLAIRRLSRRVTSTRCS